MVFGVSQARLYRAPCRRAHAYAKTIFCTCRFAVNTFIARNVRVQSVLVKKTIYGRCPKCKAKSDLVVMSGDPGREKFKCNQCYHVFGMDEL